MCGVYNDCAIKRNVIKTGTIIVDSTHSKSRYNLKSQREILVDSSKNLRKAIYRIDEGYKEKMPVLITFLFMAYPTLRFTSFVRISVSFSLSFRNFVNVLGLMTGSSGASPRKNLNDISYMERSTTSTSDKV